MRLGLGLGNDLHGQSRGGVFGQLLLDQLLLDQYSGASAAYSLRKIKGNTTNVVRVRRSSDNAEADFTAAEITDGTLETWVGANDGFVTTWYDQSGNNNDATQATASNQSKIVDVGTLVTDGGSPSIYFDGTKELTAFGFSGSAVQDTYFVLNYEDGGDAERMSLYDLRSNNTERYSYYADSGDAGQPFAGYGSPDLYINGTLTSITDRADVYTEFISNNDRMIRVDQGADTSTWQDISFGLWFPSFGFIGHLQELIIFDSDQSSNRTAIEDNINSYYNIY